MSEAIIRLVGVARRFTSPPRTVFSDVDLEVDAGEMVALVGPSGGGKTTLLSIMGALDSRFSGRVDLVGQSLSGLSDDALSRLRGETIGFVFQAFHLLDHLSVVENVELALWLIGASVAPAEARERASEALSNVGLGGRDDERVAQLSGGERQRVAIARAV
ncbi:MAG: ATP-binding cassette domain-containing protein, partial [Planctomycetota bacterium]